MNLNVFLQSPETNDTEFNSLILQVQQQHDQQDKDVFKPNNDVGKRHC